MASTKTSKTKRPYPAFPLYPHNSGQWSKKTRGKTYYFGTWDDPDAALARFHKEWPFLVKGLQPPDDDATDPDALTLEEMANRFMEANEEKVNAGDLTLESFRDYHRTLKALLAFAAYAPVG